MFSESLIKSTVSYSGKTSQQPQTLIFKKEMHTLMLYIKYMDICKKQVAVPTTQISI